MRRVAIALATLLAAALCTSGAIAHSEAAVFSLSSGELAQTPIIRGLTDTEKALLARSFDGQVEDQTLDDSAYAAAWRLSDWTEALAQTLAAFWDPRLIGVLFWLLGLGVTLWLWGRPVSKAEAEE